jgi:hypothetical protein
VISGKSSFSGLVKCQIGADEGLIVGRLLSYKSFLCKLRDSEKPFLQGENGFRKKRKQSLPRKGDQRVGVKKPRKKAATLLRCRENSHLFVEIR